MKEITIGFSRASTEFPIFSWLIMAVQKSKYSHVYIKYGDEALNRTVYYQASHTLVNYMSEATFLGQETIYKEFKFKVSDASFLTIQQFMIDNAGLPYGVMECVGLAAVNLALFFDIKIHNPLKEAGKTWICDQIIAELLKTCEKVRLPIPIDDMMPTDVFNLVSTLPRILSLD